MKAMPSWSRRCWLTGVLGAALAPGAPAQTLPPPLDGQWHDTARGRELPWRLRLPAGAGPWPLVLYSHGLGGSREGGEVWGDAWRAAGVAVLHLQHPGSDAGVLRAGLRAMRSAASAEQLVTRTLDVRFALDELEHRRRDAQAPWRMLRPGAVGLAGHSFGAQTTQAVAGQRFPMPTSLADPRPRAFIAFSPSAGRVALPLAHQFGAIERPFLGVTGSLDGDPFGSFAGGEPRARIFDGLPPGRRALLWLDRADHMTFAGNAQLRIGGRGLQRREPDAERREDAHHALVAGLSTLWWRAHLMGDDVARGALAAPAGLGPNDRFTLD
jgi:dienelactone hydrolase